jgi:hypothetical protein
MMPGRGSVGGWVGSGRCAEGAQEQAAGAGQADHQGGCEHGRAQARAGGQRVRGHAAERGCRLHAGPQQREDAAAELSGDQPHPQGLRPDRERAAAERRQGQEA